MKVLLVQASGINRVNPEIAQPLGLMYLAAVIRRAGHEDPRIIETRFLDRPLEEEIKNYRPDLVGVSGLTQDFPVIHETLRKVRSTSPDTPLIIGGPHASSTPDSILDDTPADFAVMGEGEETILELIEAIEGKREMGSVAGIIYRGDGEVIATEPRKPIQDLDSLPYPAWDLIPLKKYSRDPRFVHIRAREDFMILFTSRACPYNCVFCHRLFGKGFRARSPENVLGEIRELYDRYGISEFEIWDDCFNLDSDRTKKILRDIAGSGMDVKIAFQNGVRGDRLDPEMLRLMRDAGVYHIAFAIETGSERIQKVIRKNLDIDKTLDAIREAASLKMFTRGFFMMGFPTETKADILKTIDVAVRSDLHLASFFMANAFPGTELFEMARSMGKAIDLPYDKYDYNDLSTNLCEVSSEELEALQRKAYFRFFMSGMRPYRLLRDLPNKGMLTRHFRQLMRRMRFIG